MRFWQPDPAEPQLLEWWLPLVRVGRRALVADLPWLILLDEWHFVGKVQRRPRPDVWIYSHAATGCELYADDSGQTYRFIPNASGPSAGRFQELKLRYALWRARLPDVAEWTSERRPPPRYLEEEDWPDDQVTGLRLVQ